MPDEELCELCGEESDNDLRLCTSCWRLTCDECGQWDGDEWLCEECA